MAFAATNSSYHQILRRASNPQNLREECPENPDLYPSYVRTVSNQSQHDSTSPLNSQPPTFRCNQNSEEIVACTHNDDWRTQFDLERIDNSDSYHRYKNEEDHISPGTSDSFYHHESQFDRLRHQFGSPVGQVPDMSRCSSGRSPHSPSDKSAPISPMMLHRLPSCACTASHSNYPSHSTQAPQIIILPESLKDATVALIPNSCVHSRVPQVFRVSPSHRCVSDGFCTKTRNFHESHKVHYSQHEYHKPNASEDYLVGPNYYSGKNHEISEGQCNCYEHLVGRSNASTSWGKPVRETHCIGAGTSYKGRSHYIPFISDYEESESLQDVSSAAAYSPPHSEIEMSLPLSRNTISLLLDKGKAEVILQLIEHPLHDKKSPDYLLAIETIKNVLEVVRNEYSVVLSSGDATENTLSKLSTLMSILLSETDNETTPNVSPGIKGEGTSESKTEEVASHESCRNFVNISTFDHDSCQENEHFQSTEGSEENGKITSRLSFSNKKDSGLPLKKRNIRSSFNSEKLNDWKQQQTDSTARDTPNKSDQSEFPGVSDPSVSTKRHIQHKYKRPLQQLSNHLESSSNGIDRSDVFKIGKLPKEGEIVLFQETSSDEISADEEQLRDELLSECDLPRRRKGESQSAEFLAFQKLELVSSSEDELCKLHDKKLEQEDMYLSAESTLDFDLQIQQEKISEDVYNNSEKHFKKDELTSEEYTTQNNGGISLSENDIFSSDEKHEGSNSVPLKGMSSTGGDVPADREHLYTTPDNSSKLQDTETARPQVEALKLVVKTKRKKATRTKKTKSIPKQEKQHCIPKQKKIELSVEKTIRNNEKQKKKLKKKLKKKQVTAHGNFKKMSTLKVESEKDASPVEVCIGDYPNATYKLQSKECVSPSPVVAVLQTDELESDHQIVVDTQANLTHQEVFEAKLISSKILGQEMSVTDDGNEKDVKFDIPEDEALTDNAVEDMFSEKQGDQLQKSSEGKSCEENMTIETPSVSFASFQTNVSSILKESPPDESLGSETGDIVVTSASGPSAPEKLFSEKEDENKTAKVDKEHSSAPWTDEKGDVAQPPSCRQVKKKLAYGDYIKNRKQMHSTSLPETNLVIDVKRLSLSPPLPDVAADRPPSPPSSFAASLSDPRWKRSLSPTEICAPEEVCADHIEKNPCYAGAHSSTTNEPRSSTNEPLSAPNEPPFAPSKNQEEDSAISVNVPKRELGKLFHGKPLLNRKLGHDPWPLPLDVEDVDLHLKDPRVTMLYMFPPQLKTHLNVLHWEGDVIVPFCKDDYHMERKAADVAEVNDEGLKETMATTNKKVEEEVNAEPTDDQQRKKGLKIKGKSSSIQVKECFLETTNSSSSRINKAPEEESENIRKSMEEDVNILLSEQCEMENSEFSGVGPRSQKETSLICSEVEDSGRGTSGLPPGEEVSAHNIVEEEINSPTSLKRSSVDEVEGDNTRVVMESCEQEFSVKEFKQERSNVPNLGSVVPSYTQIKGKMTVKIETGPTSTTRCVKEEEVENQDWFLQMRRGLNESNYGEGYRHGMAMKGATVTSQNIKSIEDFVANIRSAVCSESTSYENNGPSGRVKTNETPSSLGSGSDEDQKEIVLTYKEALAILKLIKVEIHQDLSELPENVPEFLDEEQVGNHLSKLVDLYSAVETGLIATERKLETTVNGKKEAELKEFLGDHYILLTELCILIEWVAGPVRYKKQNLPHLEKGAFQRLYKPTNMLTMFRWLRNRYETDSIKNNSLIQLLDAKREAFRGKRKRDAIEDDESKKKVEEKNFAGHDDSVLKKRKHCILEKSKPKNKEVKKMIRSVIKKEVPEGLSSCKMIKSLIKKEKPEIVKVKTQSASRKARTQRSQRSKGRSRSRSKSFSRSKSCSRSRSRSSSRESAKRVCREKVIQLKDIGNASILKKTKSRFPLESSSVLVDLCDQFDDIKKKCVDAIKDRGKEKASKIIEELPAMSEKAHCMLDLQQSLMKANPLTSKLHKESSEGLYYIILEIDLLFTCLQGLADRSKEKEAKNKLRKISKKPINKPPYEEELRMILSIRRDYTGSRLWSQMRPDIDNRLKYLQNKCRKKNITMGSFPQRSQHSYLSSGGLCPTGMVNMPSHPAQSIPSLFANVLPRSQPVKMVPDPSNPGNYVPLLPTLENPTDPGLIQQGVYCPQLNYQHSYYQSITTPVAIPAGHHSVVPENQTYGSDRRQHLHWGGHYQDQNDNEVYVDGRWTHINSWVI